MDKISIINEYNLLKSYQKSNSSTINRAFDVIYYSIINPEFLILKNNKYYKYSNSSFEEIQTDKIIPTTSSISYNNYNIFYIKNNGETYTIINDDNLTYKILSLKNAIRLTGNLSKKYIVKVSCGDSHALFLTHAGMVFSIGDNNLGQLGLGENEKIKETGEAIMIKELLNYRIIDISTGNNHCLAFGVVRDLTKVNNKDNNNNKNENKDNITFTWGDNSFGQCGIKDNKITFINSPNKILINDNEIINDGVKSIFCGLNFSVLLLNDGKIFGFGDNQFHQLDLNNDVKKIYHPQELIVDCINNKKAKVVNLIVSSFSLGLITDGKFIYVLGKYSGLGNEGKIIELENNIDKGIKVVLTDDKIFFFYYMNGERKIVKEVKSDKKNTNKNTTPLKKKISMPKLTNKDNNTINTTPLKSRTKNDKTPKINDRYSTYSSNETNTNITNNSNNSGTSNPSSKNNTIGNNSSSNLTSAINNNIQNNTLSNNNNNSKTPISNSRKTIDLNNNNNVKMELKTKTNNNPIQIKSKNELNQELKKEELLIKKTSSSSSNNNNLNNKKKENSTFIKSNSLTNLPQKSKENQVLNPLSNTQISVISPYNNILNTKKTFTEENEINKSVISDIGEFFTSQFSSIRKNYFKRRDISKENYFNDFCKNFFLESQYKNQMKKKFYSGISDKLRGKVWLKCLGNKFSITEDYFNIQLEKAEKLNILLEIKQKIDLPFKYLGLFKENSPMTEDFYNIISAFIASRPDIGIQKEISYLTGILLINMRKFQSYVSLLNILLNPNIICYYLNDNEKIQKNCQIFKQIFLFNLPDLCSFFEINNILPEDYFVIWNKTLFSKSFNIDIIMRIWDIYFIEGPRAIFEASISLLSELNNELMEADDKENILNILLNHDDKELDEEKIIEKMNKVKFPIWIQDEIKKMGEYLLPMNY